MACLLSAYPMDFLTSSSEELNKLLDASDAEIKNLVWRVSRSLNILEGFSRTCWLNVGCNRQAGAMHMYLRLQ